jgi:hypothetical protein
VFQFVGSNEGGQIRCLTTTNDSKILFSADEWGCLLQFDIEKKTLMYDYGEISRGSIRSMAVSGDGSNLFASDVFGSFKEFSIPQSCLLKEHTIAHVNGRLQTTSAREYPESGFNQILTSKGQLVTCENSG